MAITNMDFAAMDAPDFVPSGPTSATLIGAIRRDPIATV